MKKSSKVLGSVIASAALVMGTAVPAFAEVTTDSAQDSSNKTYAEDGTGSDTEYRLTGSGLSSTGVEARTNSAGVISNSDFDASGASTVINISTYTSQINVTVPLKISVALDTVGGVGYAPSDGKYKIVNKSQVPVKIASADYYINKAAGEVEKWTFGNDTMMVAGKKAIERPNAGTPQGGPGGDAPSIGSMYIKISQYDNNANGGTSAGYYSTTALELADMSSAWVSGQPKPQTSQFGTKTLNWVVAPATTNASTNALVPMELPLKIEAGSSVLKSSGTTTNNAAGIVFTVGL